MNRTCSIPKRREGFIRRVVAKFQAMGLQIRVNLVPGSAEQRTHYGELYAIGFSPGDLPDTAEAGRSRAAKQIKQKRLDEIVSMVAEEDCATTAATRDAREEFVARVSSGSFDRLP